MKIRFSGIFSSYQLSCIAKWIGEHLADISILEINNFIYVCDCKITKLKRNDILVEGENSKMQSKKRKNLSRAIKGGNN